MVWQFNLLTGACVALALAIASPVGATAASIDPCTRLQQQLGRCHTSGSSDGAGVTVTGTIHREHNGAGQPDRPGAPGPQHTLTDAELLALLDELCVGDGHCDVRTGGALNPLLRPGTPGAAPAGSAPVAAIAITDLARFLPANAALHAEPDGWAVVGVPANVWVEVRAVTVDGSLLGDTAQVRFTPRAYRFDYGDGTIRTAGTPGASWAALGQAELTETPTSHVYGTRGDRRTSVTVVYSAEYRFAGGPWVAVTGAVSGTTPQQRVLVVVERTALTTPG
jgi:hypothetical protein